MIIGNNSYIAESAVIADDTVIGNNVCIQENVSIGAGSKIQDGSVICAGSRLGANCYVDFHVIIRENVELGNHAFVGSGCILGEFLADFINTREAQIHKTFIGNEAVIRSETIIYGANTIGDHFQTGHRVTIREKTSIGHHVRIGTLSDIQGDCEIGNYVSIHSNAHIGMRSMIKDYVWIYPYVVLTNDPNPPSTQLLGVTVEEFAVVATGSIVMPGMVIGKDSLVGAGAIVNKNVAPGKVVVGNPVREIGDTANVKYKTTGEPAYPWRYHFDRGMPWMGIGYDEWAALTVPEEK